MATLHQVHIEGVISIRSPYERDQTLETVDTVSDHSSRACSATGSRFHSSSAQMFAKIEGMSRDIEQLTRVVGLLQNRLVSTETSVITGDRYVLPDINDNALARQPFDSSVCDTAQGHDRSILDQPYRSAGRQKRGKGEQFTPLTSLQATAVEMVSSTMEVGTKRNVVLRR
ncbi:hypothetical protein DPMN_039868 [Dreissena polymorpha]|uniref:Uncharacterized protein n=1 Tax=Dreissena polymorpha TaxID=45954 RepID=A0A9D4CU06_DREPO|nr:hypothetical protein DPMN_039868 [Dreissena polymorpha]